MSKESMKELREHQKKVVDKKEGFALSGRCHLPLRSDTEEGWVKLEETPIITPAHTQTDQHLRDMMCDIQDIQIKVRRLRVEMEDYIENVDLLIGHLRT